MNCFFQKLNEVLKNIVQQDYAQEIVLPLWESSARQEFGDLSSPAALRLASSLKRKPMDIAVEIKARLEEYFRETGELDRIEVLKPGFVNVFFSRTLLFSSLNALQDRGADFFRGADSRKVLIEFVSANPTGPLSIAHGRQAVVGDTIANILEFCGNRVTREYYLNDAGRQKELFENSLRAAADILQGKDVPFPEDGYKGEYIYDIAREFLAQKDHDEIGKFGLSKMIESIGADLAAADISFDTWFSQQRMMDEGAVDKVIALLKEKGLLYEKEDALWFKATSFGDDKDRVIRKADGELTYFASDIAYHRDKFKRDYDCLINLWGPDHHGYIQRVKSSIDAIGYSSGLLQILIIQLVTLRTKERMSKRAGTFIQLSELLNDVGKDAVRYYYVTRRNSSHLEFDIDLAKESSVNNPLYYIQYACARIESIFKKAGEFSPDPQRCRYLKEDSELNLLRFLFQFPYRLEKAYATLEPVFIVEYLKELAGYLHKFYECVRVVGEEENLVHARLMLLSGTRIVLHCGLKLLGITPSQKM